MPHREITLSKRSVKQAMELSMTDQGIVFLFSCVVGIFLGAFYDVFRIIRIAFNSKWLSVFFQDFIFCILSALTVILLVFYTNSGVVRWFSLLGCFMSFLLYHQTIGKIVMFMAKKIIDFIRRVLNFIKSITIVPAKKLTILIARLIKRFALFIFAQIRTAKANAYYKRQKNSAKRAALRGFDLYKPEKVPKKISCVVDAEIKKQTIENKTQEKELKQINKKPREYKKSSAKSQSLGSLKTLSSIKFK